MGRHQLPPCPDSGRRRLDDTAHSLVQQRIVEQPLGLGKARAGSQRGSLGGWGPSPRFIDGCWLWHVPPDG
ncbi:hypothetical protein DB30_07771 [Enhygromyxa salina]|uniref:Uncharacterized protein n=1 Tax=Enhygromyxa salina TaxID=215803 RepID=A0A0C2D6H2_9BACT|nr:hypothetical protein DB30_07771 [Enhygromyxa salina]